MSDTHAEKKSFNPFTEVISAISSFLFRPEPADPQAELEELQKKLQRSANDRGDTAGDPELKMDIAKAEYKVGLQKFDELKENLNNRSLWSTIMAPGNPKLRGLTDDMLNTARLSLEAIKVTKLMDATKDLQPDDPLRMDALQEQERFRKHATKAGKPADIDALINNLAHSLDKELTALKQKHSVPPIDKETAAAVSKGLEGATYGGSSNTIQKPALTNGDQAKSSAINR